MKAALVALVIATVLGGLGLGNVIPPSNLVEGGIPEAEPVPVMQPVEIVPEDVAEEPQDDAWQEESEDWGWEPEYVEPEPYIEPEGVEWSGDVDLRSAGVVNDGGNTYTWYSENVLPGNGLTDLNNNGRTTNDEGFVTDGDGYIAIASPDESIPIGTEVDTPWGTAKVYDYNPGSSWDVYTGW